MWEELGLSTEPSRKVQGGDLGGNNPIALALGGTSRVVLRRCMWQACKHVLYDVELRPRCWLLEGLQSMPTLYLGKAGLRVCPGGTFGSVCAKSVHGVSLTAWTYSRTHTSSVSFPSRRPRSLD